MFRTFAGAMLIAAAAGWPALSAAAQGSCGHNEMRAWIDAEEECYHRYGPMTEQWSLTNQVNLEVLSTCLKGVKSVYRLRRLACEQRGETPYRVDGIHRHWEEYRRVYDDRINQLRAGG